MKIPIAGVSMLFTECRYLAVHKKYAHILQNPTTKKFCQNVLYMCMLKEIFLIDSNLTFNNHLKIVCKKLPTISRFCHIPSEDKRIISVMNDAT